MPGTVRIEVLTSEVLQNNPLNDPHQRKLAVYLPPSYTTAPSRRFPVIYLLSGFMGYGTMMLSPQAWGYAIDERCDKLIAEHAMEECIVVMPDCFTRWGGAQYMNSPATGNYEDYIIREIIPYIDRTFRTQTERNHRGIMGKSSGGFGALRLAVNYPELFSAFFCSAGDMYFEYGYKPDIPKTYNALYKTGGLDGFLKKFFEAPKKSGEQITAINIIAMAAAYSPQASEPYGIELPFDLQTGALKESVWQRWIAHDPVFCVDQKAWRENLSKINHVFLDCGARDEYHLHIGARIFTDKLRNYSIPHWYEEFDDGHMGTSYRYDVSLSKLSRSIA